MESNDPKVRAEVSASFPAVQDAIIANDSPAERVFWDNAPHAPPPPLRYWHGRESLRGTRRFAGFRFEAIPRVSPAWKRSAW